MIPTVLDTIFKILIIKYYFFTTKTDFQNFDWDFFRGFSDFPVEIANIPQISDVSIELFIEKPGKHMKI